MSEYIKTTCYQLVKVLDYAKGLHPHRVAGYAANLDFWVEEVEHALRLVREYPSRFSRTKQAVKTVTQQLYDGANPSRSLHQNYCEVCRGPESHKEAVVKVTRTLTNDDVWELTEQVKNSAAAFLRRCRKLELVDDAKYRELGNRLGLDLSSHETTETEGGD